MFIEKKNCTGCGACSQICSSRAISMKYDEEGFLYPYVNHDLCNNCGACYRVCHMKEKVNLKSQPLSVYAASLIEDRLLTEVSSGGVFWILAKNIIEKNGVVYGVEQPTLFDIHHSRAESLEECKPFRRSKYLESNIGKMFIVVKKDLCEGKRVLFTGTGCQIAGLYGFLGNRDYENLITCEVVCHGVPSMKVFKAFIREVESYSGKKIKGIVYRDKSKGWKNNCIRIIYSDGSYDIQLSSIYPLHRGYLSGYYYRPSCSSCKYASIPRVADITLADYWKYEGEIDYRKDKGISLVVISSAKGKSFFDGLRDQLIFDSTDLKKAINSSIHLIKPPSDSKFRSNFIKEIDKKGFHATYKKYRRRDMVLIKISGRVIWLKNKITKKS